MVTQQIAIKKVSDFTQELKSLGIHLRKVILFGSYARNEQRQWSDIDVAIAADEFIGIGYNDRKFFSMINIKNEYMEIETKTYPTDYFNEGDPFIDEIKRTGIEIEV